MYTRERIALVIDSEAHYVLTGALFIMPQTIQEEEIWSGGNRTAHFSQLSARLEFWRNRGAGVRDIDADRQPGICGHQIHLVTLAQVDREVGAHVP